VQKRHLADFVVLLPVHHEGIAGVSAGQPQPLSFFQSGRVWFDNPFSNILLNIQVEFDSTLVDKEQAVAVWTIQGGNVLEQLVLCHVSCCSSLLRFRGPTGAEIVRQDSRFGLTIPATGDNHFEH
jgi:hypothetical protein